MTCGLAGVDVSAVCALENDTVARQTARHLAPPRNGAIDLTQICTRNYIYGRLWPSVQQRQRGSDWTDLFAQGLPRIDDRVVIAAVDLVGETV